MPVNSHEGGTPKEENKISQQKNFFRKKTPPLYPENLTKCMKSVLIKLSVRNKNKTKKPPLKSLHKIVESRRVQPIKYI